MVPPERPLYPNTTSWNRLKRGPCLVRKVSAGIQLTKARRQISPAAFAAVLCFCSRLFRRNEELFNFGANVDFGFALGLRNFPHEEIPSGIEHTAFSEGQVLFISQHAEIS